MNLKEIRERYMGEFRRDKGREKCNLNTISKIKKKFKSYYGKFFLNVST